MALKYDIIMTNAANRPDNERTANPSPDYFYCRCGRNQEDNRAGPARDAGSSSLACELCIHVEAESAG